MMLDKSFNQLPFRILEENYEREYLKLTAEKEGWN